MNNRRNLLVDNKSGDEFVDLGLPSGLKWCSHNIGGTNPEDYGYYFSWGNVDGYAKGSNYIFSQSTYDSTTGHYLSKDIPVDYAYDIARLIMDSPWRLPTKDEFKELCDNTNSEWINNYNGTGIAGYKFMKKSDPSVYIFFPACGYYAGRILIDEGTFGYYWSSTYYDSSYACCLRFNSSKVIQYYIDRYYGFPGRAVQ